MNIFNAWKAVERRKSAALAERFAQHKARYAFHEENEKNIRRFA